MKYGLIILSILIIFGAGFYLGYNYNTSEIINPNSSTVHVPDDPSPCLYNPIGIELLKSRDLLTVTATDGCKRTKETYDREVRRHMVTAGIGYTFTGLTYIGGYNYNVLGNFWLGSQAIISSQNAGLFITASYNF